MKSINMAYFYSIRGWLEVEPEKFEKANHHLYSLQKRETLETKEALYLKGWCWQHPSTTINWTRYIAFLCLVRYIPKGQKLCYA